MLVLTRKVGQRIRIGDSIILSVVRIKGAGVRIGIEAPRGVAVVREEIDRKPKRARPPREGEGPPSTPENPPEA